MIDNLDTKSYSPTSATDGHVGGHVGGQRPTLRLYNTLQNAPQEFVPLRAGEVALYCCGPTVYNYAHIGNLRTYIFEDTLRRTLELLGYRVRHVMNITDIGHLTDDGDEGEDKIIRSAREQGKTVWDIANHYTDRFFVDIDKLNILRPSIVCRATDHIDDMIALVQRIEEQGYCYRAGGNVYFDTVKYAPYGKLARLDQQQLRAGARVGIDSSKRSPYDFVLWFTRSKFERQAMIWDSPWGRGYPGWHLECSAMSMRYLGEQFDIHCGGVDHIPVHHTNEIAQVESVTGKQWVNFWLHAEFLNMQNVRMSKSEGKFVTITDLEARGFDALDLRYLCLNSHYRKQLQFSIDALQAARSARLRLSEYARRAPAADQAGDDRMLQNVQTDFYDAIGDDLNMARCLALLWGLSKHPQSVRQLELMKQIDGVLGLRLFDDAPSDAARPDAPDAEQAARIEARIVERTTARQQRDWARADAIRTELAAEGILLTDDPAGTRWQRQR